MTDERPRTCLSRDIALLLLGATLAVALLGALLGGCCMTPGIGPL